MFDDIKTLLLTFTIYTKTNYRVYYFQDDEGHDHRVDDRRPGADGLHRQLVGIAVQQPLGADRSEDAGGKRPPQTADPMDRDDIERMEELQEEYGCGADNSDESDACDWDNPVEVEKI